MAIRAAAQAIIYFSPVTEKKHAHNPFSLFGIGYRVHGKVLAKMFNNSGELRHTFS